MNITGLIIVAVCIVLAYFIIKILSKVLSKIISVVIVLGLLAFLLFYWKGGVLNFGEKDFVLYELQEKYCNQKLDTIKCECIILPLLEDIKNNYSQEELSEFKDDELKSSKIILESLDRKKQEITQCLENHDAKYTLDDFIEDMKKLRLGEKIENILDSFDKSSE